MTILVAVTAALALHASPPPASAASDVRTISVLPVIGVVVGTKRPRYVRLRLDVTAYGVPGHGEIVVDRMLGRFVRRFDAGPVSEREGWDGVHPWRADATGMPRIEGNVDERGEIRAWARMLAPAARNAPCECGSRPPDVATDPAGVHVTSVALHVGQETQHASFGDYRRAGSFVVPFALEYASENGTWSARVRSVETPRTGAPNAFAPPAAPHDAALNGIASVPLVAGSSMPLIEVSIDHGPPLRCLLDTGGQNAITPSAAQRAGLNVVGAGAVGGAGAGLANVRYARTRSVRVGTAELRDQPFIVLDFGAGAPFDCIAGYELLARFAARIDFANGSLELATDARAFPGGGISVPMTFADRQPQVDGALDDIAGAVTIDTGSAIGAEVNAPFVRAHDLVARYHAVPSGASVSGVGGPVRTSVARADELRLGELRIRNVPLMLAEATAGAEANPTVAINLGDQVLRRYTLVLDYRGGTIRFDTPQPGARPTASPAPR
ncbi:MAG: retropepsin-like domain-containing protein [Candidatus Eremiobacteraeota bacterium]|nr:retropepsin-like domain-containing protein [Candidatus Eremiobacteraeota bacterium]